MNTRTAMAAIAAVACLTLGATACGADTDTGDSAKPKASKSSSKPSASKKPDCGPNSKLSSGEWVDQCGEGQGLGAEGDAKPKPLGTAVKTVGSGGEGELEVTPTSVVFTAKAMDETSEKGVFAVVTVQDKATLNVAAADERLAGGGGWQWIAKDGLAIEFQNTQAALGITPESFTGGGPIQAGTNAWDSQRFDLTKEQAKGGTLMYVDGAGVAYKWKTPAADSGPQAEQLRRELAQ